MALKFRAYDKKYKSMDDVFQLDWWHDDLRVNDDTFSDYVVMQSAGLHDKHGVEIFEGDIVSHSDGELSYKGVVTNDSVTCWWIKGIEPDDNFSFGDVTDYTYRTCDLVVKGNVYENPELLEDL